MKYVIQVLEAELKKANQSLESANNYIADYGGNHMRNSLASQAGLEVYGASKSLAEERIPQIEKALSILRNEHTS